MSPVTQIIGLVVFTFCTWGLGLIPYWALVIKGSQARAAAASAKLNSTLMKQETIVVSALQQRLAALITRRQLIALTNSRIILIDRSVLGGFSMRDYQWKDLRDAQLSENIMPQWFGSKLSFLAGNASVVIDGLQSDVAAKAYAHAQEQEQAWEEKHRVRGLEEKRAAAGGVVVHGAGGAAPANSNNVLEELEKAKRLFDAGAVSDAEYQEIKAKILSRAS
jgi:hypothetical protein